MENFKFEVSSTLVTMFSPPNIKISLSITMEVCYKYLKKEKRNDRKKDTPNREILKIGSV